MHSKGRKNKRKSKGEKMEIPVPHGILLAPASLDLFSSVGLGTSSLRGEVKRCFVWFAEKT